MSSVSVSFRTPQAKVEKLDEFARSSKRDRTQLINEAIDHYIFLQELNLKKIDAGLRAVEEGRFATDAAVEAEFAKWHKR